MSSSGAASALPLLAPGRSPFPERDGRDLDLMEYLGNRILIWYVLNLVRCSRHARGGGGGGSPADRAAATKFSSLEI
eukprot:SAG31_NODE_2595_length_5421_cov_2.387636_7_plen_77_part_00